MTRGNPKDHRSPRFARIPLGRGSLSVLAYLCFLVGCTTSAVNLIGPETFTLSATRCGLCEPVSAYVAEQATKFCATKSAQLVVKSVNANNAQPMFPGSATITFTCSTDQRATLVKQATEQCQMDYKDANLDSIRTKIEITRPTPDSPPPFQMASDQSYPTDVEKSAISKWATLRDDCLARQRTIPAAPPGAAPLQIAYSEQERAFDDEVSGKVSALIVALYQGKLTYGEFAQKRYEFGKDGAETKRTFLQATLLADQQRQLEAQRLAQERFQAKVQAWSAYIQAVNSRPAQTTVTVQQQVNVH